LIDNARALVVEHDPTTRTVVFNEKFKAFAKHLGFRPARLRSVSRAHQRQHGERRRLCEAERDCRPQLPELGSLEAHLAAWTRDVADVRLQARPARRRSTDSNAPRAKLLKPVAGVPPFHAARGLIRRVQSDCAVEIDGNAYSEPCRLIGETVRATITDGVVRIYHGLHEVAVHPICSGRRRRVIDPGHFAGPTGIKPIDRTASPNPYNSPAVVLPGPTLLSPRLWA
jgi:hypothetical protein